MAIAIERSEDFITLTLTDKITADDLYRGVDALYESDPPAKVLWDLTDAEVLDVPDGTNQLRSFSSYAAEKGKSRKGSKVAVISREDVQFGMARMTAAFAELNEAAYDMKIFRDQPTALAWLEMSD